MCLFASKARRKSDIRGTAVDGKTLYHVLLEDIIRQNAKGDRGGTFGAEANRNNHFEIIEFGLSSHGPRSLISKQ